MGLVDHEAVFCLGWETVNTLSDCHHEWLYKMQGHLQTKIRIRHLKKVDQWTVGKKKTNSNNKNLLYLTYTAFLKHSHLFFMFLLFQFLHGCSQPPLLTIHCSFSTNVSNRHTLESWSSSGSTLPWTLRHLQ